MSGISPVQPNDPLTPRAPEFYAFLDALVHKLETDAAWEDEPETRVQLLDYVDRMKDVRTTCRERDVLCRMILEDERIEKLDAGCLDPFTSAQVADCARDALDKLHATE